MDRREPRGEDGTAGAEKARSRVLREDELRAVVTYLDRPAPETPTRPSGANGRSRAALRLRLVTAQRGGEVIAMRWGDIDGDWWTIPAEDAKNKLPHRVPLTAAALDVLKTVKAEADDDAEYVFAGIRGTRQRRGALDGLNVKDVRPHDFRRTAASRMAVSRRVAAGDRQGAQPRREGRDGRATTGTPTMPRSGPRSTRGRGCSRRSATGRKARVVPIRRRS